MKNIKILLSIVVLVVLMSLTTKAQTGPVSICRGSISSPYTAIASTSSHRWVLFDANNVDVSGTFNSNEKIKLLVGGVKQNWGSILGSSQTVTVEVASDQPVGNFKITAERFKNVW